MGLANVIEEQQLLGVQPLENGDRLTRSEFERRYEAMPELKKAEFLEGVVHMASPVRLRRHSLPHLQLASWIGNYLAETPGVIGADNSTVRLDLDNEPQPDLLLMVDPARGGQARISDDDYIEGAPELVVEIAASSASYDLDVKLRVYRGSGVREYIVWRVLDNAIDWFVLRDGVFAPLAAASGIVRSEKFAGLWLNVDAMLTADLSTVLATLRRGLDTPEHKTFVTQLRS